MVLTSPAGTYLLKVNNRNTKTRCEICLKLTIKTPERRHWRRLKLTIKTPERRHWRRLKLTIKTPERRHWRRSGVFIVNFKHISLLVLVILLLTLNM